MILKQIDHLTKQLDAIGIRGRMLYYFSTSLNCTIPLVVHFIVHFYSIFALLELRHFVCILTKYLLIGVDIFVDKLKDSITLSATFTKFVQQETPTKPKDLLNIPQGFPKIPGGSSDPPALFFRHCYVKLMDILEKHRARRFFRILVSGTPGNMLIFVKLYNRYFRHWQVFIRAMLSPQAAKGKANSCLSYEGVHLEIQTITYNRRN